MLMMFQANAEKYGPLVGRILLAFMFIMAGVDKINGYEGTQAYMNSMGVPGALLPLVIITEVVGGFAIVLGWQTRLAAFALAGFTIISGLLFHYDPENQMQMIMLMKNFSIAGGFLLLVAMGPGPFALDNRGKASDD